MCSDNLVRYYTGWIVDNFEERTSLFVARATNSKFIMALLTILRGRLIFFRGVERPSRKSGDGRASGFESRGAFPESTSKQRVILESAAQENISKLDDGMLPSHPCENSNFYY